MSTENDNSFLTSVITAASSTASSIATNLSDRLKEPSQEQQLEKSGDGIMDSPGSLTSDTPEIPAMIVNKRNNGRTHSHTISGDRPPVIITNAKLVPSPQRRNSDGGSPRLPLPTLGENLQPTAPTATTATSETAIFSNTAPSLSLEHLEFSGAKPVSETWSIHSASSDSALINHEQKTPIVGPETPVTKEMLVVPRRKPRPRGASVSTANSDAKGVSLSRSNSGASRKMPRKDSDDTDVDNVSEGVLSAAAGSIASACGLELANAKRNNDYHALFRSVPEDDVLIEDYGCALQKEILVQGRMYISETHVCFNANIFGWVTNLVIAFTEIVAIEKRMTAKIIPNAIQISTLHSKHLFASFLSRDQAYDQLIDIWHVAHPNLNSRILQSKIAALEYDNAENDKNESDSYSDESDETGSEYDSDEYTEISEEEEDEDELDVKLRSDGQASIHTLPLPLHRVETEAESRRRAVSELPARPNPKDLLKPTKREDKQPSSTEESSAADKSNGSVTPAKVIKHAPTECECSKKGEHFPNIALDETYTGTLETINNLLYNSGFTKKFLIEKEKSTDVNIGNWEKGTGNVRFTRETTYIKYLGGSIGPKTTKCLLTDEVFHFDLDDYITQLTTTQTPDVPSGSSFCVKTRTCLTWAGDNKVRMLVTFQIEFSKSSWLKSTIEKASADGQIAHFKSLDETVKKYIKMHPNEFHAAGGKHQEHGEKKKRKKRRRRHGDKEHETKEAAEKEEETRGIMHKILFPFLFISRILWSAIKIIIENVRMPTVQHMTMLFMFMMLLVSLFAAKKMADMEQQLELLTSEMQGFPSQGVWIGEQEREQVWKWLLNKDKDEHTHLEQFSTPPEADEADHLAWNTAATANLHNKQDLDRELAHLGARIQQAQQRIEKMM